ncbi:dihydropteroate synthase [Pseudoxanthomonas sp. SGD-10]|nr:dihydropteroate synthase [Pseudoxanthomonas sp. SGD-10]
MDKDTFFRTKTTLNTKGKLIDLSIPQVMGIINVTPDSFFAHSRTVGKADILERVEKMIGDGATFIDIGAYSSRPGAAEVTEEEEISRLIPAVHLIAEAFPDIIISVDTFRAEVARQAVAAGAHIINDISGGELDKSMFETVAELQVPYILMHMRGTPETMSKLTDYDDLLADIIFYFSEKVSQLKDLGVKDIILDPGFGFAKTLEQNYSLLKQMKALEILGFPILAGLSRKTMIWKALEIGPDDALNGTTVLNTIALQNGASILRVHDVREAKQCVQLTQIYNGI